MKAETKFDQIQEIIENIARKYSRNTSIEYDDFVQDLWCKACEIDTDNLALLTTTLKNKAIDMSRKSWRIQGNESLELNPNSFDGVQFKPTAGNGTNSVGDTHLYEESADYMSRVHNNDESLEVELCMTLDTLTGNTYKYAVAKGFLNGNLEFLRSRYNELVSVLSAEQVTTINEFKGRYTDDVILKVFCGIKSGTNSGSARAIKRTVKMVFEG